jgi:hypothetical protein
MASKTVVLKGQSLREELTASGAITPGHLCQIDSAGKIKVHASAGQNCYPLVAVENDIIGNDIDDAYASGDWVQAEWLYPGATFQAILKDGENVAIGDFLESAGDGTLQKHVADGSLSTVYSNQIVGIAKTALDMSGSSGADPSSARFECQVI